MEAVKDQADIVWKKVNNFITYLNRTVKKGVKKADQSTIITNKTNKTNLTK